MKVIAPGKLMLAGAYAVLEGAPAIVVAVDRYARASRAFAGERVEASREVRAAFGDEAVPACDARALYEGDSKLGLGSSAAVLVASLGLRAAGRGEDLASASTRQTIFDDARRAHAKAQGGGSGVDVAASTYGGALRYELRAGKAKIQPISLPKNLRVTTFWTGTSARTSDLLRLVADLEARDHEAHRARIDALAFAARAASRAADADDLAAFLVATRAQTEALAALGHDARAPIVPAPIAELAEIAARESSAFVPSGAGGGDVVVYLGTTAPTSAFVSRAEAHGMRTIALAIDREGVRLEATPPLL